MREKELINIGIEYFLVENGFDWQDKEQLLIKGPKNHKFFDHKTYRGQFLIRNDDSKVDSSKFTTKYDSHALQYTIFLYASPNEYYFNERLLQDGVHKVRYIKNDLGWIRDAVKDGMDFRSAVSQVNL